MNHLLSPLFFALRKGVLLYKALYLVILNFPYFTVVKQNHCSKSEKGSDFTSIIYNAFSLYCVTIPLNVPRSTGSASHRAYCYSHKSPCRALRRWACSHAAPVYNPPAPETNHVPGCAKRQGWPLPGLPSRLAPCLP